MDQTTPQHDQTTPEDQNTQLLVEIVEWEGHEHRAVLRLSGEVDLATAPDLLAAFYELADRRLSDVIVDASLVTFMDSTGLHALTQGKARIHDEGSRIALITSPQVRRVLELIYPEPLFAARVDTMEQARKALGWD